MPFPSKRLTNSERIFIQKYSIKLRKEKDSFISHAHRDRLQILERAFSFSFFVQKGDRYKKKERKLHAVITIEAALTIPLFFLAGVMLIYLLEVQATRISVKMGADTAAKKAAAAGRRRLGMVVLLSKQRAPSRPAIQEGPVIKQCFSGPAHQPFLFLRGCPLSRVRSTARGKQAADRRSSGPAMRSPANTEAPARQCPRTSRTSSPASAARQVSHFPQKELALWKMTPDSPPNRASRAICQGVAPAR